MAVCVPRWRAQDTDIAIEYKKIITNLIKLWLHSRKTQFQKELKVFLFLLLVCLSKDCVCVFIYKILAY